ncbi:MAG: hypothetical protein AB1626_05970, partial [Candidatus Micrarchaeota archaeon]
QTPSNKYFLASIPRETPVSAVLLEGFDASGASTGLVRVARSATLFSSLESDLYVVRLVNASYDDEPAWGNFTYRYWNCT